MFVDDTSLLFEAPHDVCVVGAGPVGIAVALEIARLGRRVTLLESGSMEADPDIQRLSDAVRVDERRNSDMALVVQRSFGGTSNLWGAGCVPLDPIDFEDRPWVVASGWPIGHAEFARHLPRACDYANCGTEFEQPVPGAPPGNGAFSADRLMRYADPPSFRKAHGARVAASTDISVFLGATVVGMTVQPDGRIDALTVRTRGGAVGPVRPRVTVLACGGVETTRLLLAVQCDAPGLFGGAEGPLGRFYMGHLSGAIANIRIDHAGLDRSLDFFRFRGGAYARRRLTATAAYQRRHELTNVAFWPTMPAMRDACHGDPVLSLAYLALSVPPLGRMLVSESLRRVNVGTGGNTLPHLRNVARGLPTVTSFAPRFLYARYLARRRLPGLHLRNGARRYVLLYHAEHLPSPVSRIGLSNETDAYGLRKAVLDLRFAADNARQVVRSHDHLAQWLAETGLGRLEWLCPEAEREARVTEIAGDGVHQIGAVRMTSSPHDGVVDGDGRVFGTCNLFVAGSAVFPTSGQANPTLAAITLGLRTAERVAGEAGSHQAAVPVR